MSLVHRTVGWLASIHRLDGPPARDERGVSQSTEQAILIVAAFTVGSAILVAVGTFVTDRLSVLGG